MSIFKNLSQSVENLFTADKSKSHIKHERAMHENQTAKEIDKTLKDSFPASDPPGNY